MSHSTDRIPCSVLATIRFLSPASSQTQGGRNKDVTGGFLHAPDDWIATGKDAADVAVCVVEPSNAGVGVGVVVVVLFDWVAASRTSDEKDSGLLFGRLCCQETFLSVWRSHSSKEETTVGRTGGSHIVDSSSIAAQHQMDTHGSVPKSNRMTALRRCAAILVVRLRTVIILGE